MQASQGDRRACLLVSINGGKECRPRNELRFNKRFHAQLFQSGVNQGSEDQGHQRNSRNPKPYMISLFFEHRLLRGHCQPIMGFMH